MYSDANQDKIERYTTSLMRLLIYLRIEKARRVSYWNIAAYTHRTLELSKQEG